MIYYLHYYKNCPLPRGIGFSSKISFQFQPAKLKIFKTETEFRLKNFVICTKTKFFGPAMSFQFKTETTFRLKIHLSSIKIQHCHPFFAASALLSTYSKVQTQRWTSTCSYFKMRKISMITLELELKPTQQMIVTSLVFGPTIKSSDVPDRHDGGITPGAQSRKARK